MVLETDFDNPTHDSRRQAVAGALAWAPGLVRYAARFTHTLEDAEDAYQCAMEIALTQAPSVAPKQFISWLHTVVRNEAMRIAARRERERPSPDDDLDQQLLRHGAAPQVVGTDAVYEWRERYRSVHDALSGLTEAQRVCLMLRSAGIGRGEIELLTGYSPRKVDRAINEGRARLRDSELRPAPADRCARLAPLLELWAAGTATTAEQRQLTRHIARCPSCRTEYAQRCNQLQLIASFVPAALLLNVDLMQSRTPDPTFAVTWWERASSSFTVRSGQLVQMWLDLPMLAASKLGAGAAAAAVVSVVGTPLVVNAMRSPAGPAPAVRADIALTSPPPASAPVPAVRAPAPKVVARRTPTRSRVRAKSATAPAATTWRRSVPAARASARRVPSTTRTAARPRVTRTATPAAEFGP